MNSNVEMKAATDHDLLIRLDTKVDGLIGSMTELKDGTSKHIANHELRLEAIEKLHDEVHPKDAIDKLIKLEKFVEEDKIARKVFLFLAGIIGGAIGAVGAVIGILANLKQL